MKFDVFPIDECCGGILAHTTQIPGRTFKKGHALEAQDIEDLKANCVTELTVAQLGPNDIHENEAASRVAALLAGSEVDIGPAFTGRVNLYARQSGLCVLDEASVLLANRCDEAITVATVAHYTHAQPGQMIATIKIIPFAAPLSALSRLENALSGTRSTIEIAPFRTKRVALISTSLPATREQVLTKGRDMVGRRVNALGSELADDFISEHTITDVTAQLQKAVKNANELVLILGASAIVDRRDVIPSAIEKAGGHIDHFGMPVDPGNLLLLGHIGETQVVGLPGCVRSPKLNGADWVIERFMADVPATAEDITAMGIGGLLKEIPTRPQPRDEPAMPSSKQNRLGIIVLAAGQSRRMGPENKLLLPFKGKSMVEHVVTTALEADVGPVIVVTGHEAESVKDRLAPYNVTFVHNHRYTDGLSTSIKAGVKEMSNQSVDGAFICLGDMPHISHGLIKRLATEFDPTERPICVPTTRGKMGNPVLWSATLFSRLDTIEGDSGAKSLIGQMPELVHEVAVEDDAIFVDHDTPESLKSAS